MGGAAVGGGDRFAAPGSSGDRGAFAARKAVVAEDLLVTAKPIPAWAVKAADLADRNCARTLILALIDKAPAP